jgi:hypothetical protein
MKKMSLLWQSALSAFGVFLYVTVISMFLWNIDNIFSGVDSFLAPMIMLLLLVISVTVVGLLIFGRPVYMFLNGSKRQAVTLIFYTVVWLFAITAASLIVFSASSVSA